MLTVWKRSVADHIGANTTTMHQTTTPGIFVLRPSPTVPFTSTDDDFAPLTMFHRQHLYKRVRSLPKKTKMFHCEHHYGGVKKRRRRDSPPSTPVLRACAPSDFCAILAV